MGAATSRKIRRGHLLGLGGRGRDSVNLNGTSSISAAPAMSSSICSTVTTGLDFGSVGK